MGRSGRARRESISIGWRIFNDVRQKDLSGMAQQIAYNILFSLAPMLIFIVALAGWITQAINADEPNPAEPVLQWMRDTLPSEASAFLDQPVKAALTTDPGFLLSFGAVFTLWGARNAMSAVIKGLNAAYNVDASNESWLRQTIVSLALTIGVGLMIVSGSLFIVLSTDLGGDVANDLGLGDQWTKLSAWLRWPGVAAIVVLGVALIHRFGPNMRAPLKWYLPGATFTVVAMLIATVLLGVYFSVSGGYSETYGVFGAVLAFIFWLYVMSLLMLLGGVINAAVQQELPSAQSDIQHMNRRSMPA